MNSARACALQTFRSLPPGLAAFTARHDLRLEKQDPPAQQDHHDDRDEGQEQSVAHGLGLAGVQESVVGFQAAQQH